MIKFILVDDHAIVRSGVKMLLEKTLNFRVVGEFQSGEEAIRWCRNESVDLIIMDIEMPGLSGIETIMKLRRIVPEVPIIALTMHIDGAVAKKIIKSGVSGLVGKDSVFEELLSAIKTVLGGGNYMPVHLAQSLVWMTAESSSSYETLLDSISQREMQVFSKLVAGKSVQQVASDFRLSAKTIHTYRHRLFKKLGVKSDIELMQFAIKSGFVKEKII